MTDTDGAQVTVTPLKLDENDPAALHCHYQGQYEAQPCKLTLDLESGELTAEYNPEIGNAKPMREYNGLVLSWPIPTLTAAAANKLIDEVTEAAQRILDGASVEWDGNNWVGRLDDDAETAAGRLEFAVAEAEPIDCVGELDAADWFSEGDLPDGLTAEATDEQLAAITEEQQQAASEAMGDGYTVLMGTLEFLTARREELRQEVRDQLDAVGDEIADLDEEIKPLREQLELLLGERKPKLAERDALICRVSAFGDSDRAIASLAGLSHTGVQKIVERNTGKDQQQP
jgi:hypothetical protein